MKRWTGFALVVALMTGLLGLPSMGMAADELPAVGDTVHGFTVTGVRDERLLDTKTVTMTHDKTGAIVMYIAADDVDCSFDISFRTPNLNSKGIPHVFEHITISGSEKYPAQNLFFPLITQTYNTFVNAMTFPKMTTYPLASMSEDQLMLLADYYLDGLFHPMIYNDERFFQREAWRYELTDKDAPLTITGTVYNEMRGNISIQASAQMDLLRTLYPDSIVGNVNGGDPDVIPEMTYQELLDFHDAYYHPSNSLTVLYGRMDYTRFLELLDGYFSAYDSESFALPDGRVPLRGEYVEESFDFPVEQSSPTANGSVIQYAFATDEMPLRDYVGVAILSGLLSHESSPLTREMRTRLPNAQFSVSCDPSLPSPNINFYAEGLNASDKDTFKEIIDTKLAEIVEEGIEPDLIDAMIAADEFSNRLTPEASMLGVTLSLNFANMWSTNDELDWFNLYFDAMDEVKANAHDGFFENILTSMILDNPNAALVVTSPKPGLAEEKAEALTATLAEKKAAMTDEEIDEMIASGEAFTAWSTEEAPKEIIESMQVVTASTLPEEYRQYEIVEEARDGVTLMTAQAAISEIGQTQLYLDTSGIPQDMLHYYQLYTSLLGMVDTATYERAELQMLITRYLNGVGASATSLWYEDKTWNPALVFQWMSLMEDYPQALALAREVLFESQVNDLSILQAVIGQSRLGLRNQINNLTYALQYNRAVATAFDDAAYSDYMSGIAYYEFLTEAETMLLEDPDTLVANLEAAREAIRNKQDAVIMFAGNEESTAIFKDNIDALLEGIEASPVEAVAYDLPIPARREAIAVDSAVQYNLLYSSLEDLGIDYSAKLLPLASLLYDSYLTPNIRHTIGAYDTVNEFNNRGILIISYRDPSIEETYKVYEGLARFAETAEVSQEDIDRYIVSSYSSYALPQGELSGAMSAMGNRLLGWPDDLKLTRMREIKSTTAEDLHQLAPVLERLFTHGVRSTGGGTAMIEQYADQYDTIIHLEDVAE